MHILANVAEPAQSTEYRSGEGREVESCTVAKESVELTPAGMYPLEVTLEGRTRHSRYCQASFGRRDWSCHRCAELMVGSSPRGGWQREYFARKLAEVQRRLPF